MKRTAALIVFLIVVASILLIYAINSQPKKIPSSNVILSPTQPAKPEINADTVLLFNPQVLNLENSESVNLDIDINTGKNQVTGVQLEITYDPKVLTEVKVTPGTFLPAPSILLNSIDNESGRISYALVVPPSQSPVSGTGNLAKITAKKNQKETTLNRTTLTILDKSLVSSLGIEGSVLRETNIANITFISPLDRISDEQTNIGTYEGVPIYP